MFAVIKSGGRQYKVAVGEKLDVNRLPVEVGEQVRFEEVLLISDAEKTMIGNPLVKDALVLATVTKQGRGPKLIVFKYKSKKRYRHKRGHRQELTFLTIDDIVANGKSLVTGKAPEIKGETTAAEEAEVSEVEATAEAPATPETTEEAPAETAEEAPKAEPEKRTRRRRTTRTQESEKAEE